LGISEKIRLSLKSEKTGYNVLIGYNFMNSLHRILSASCPANKYAVITDDNVYGLYGKEIIRRLRSVKLNADVFILPHGERSKNINEIIRISGEMLERGIDRKSAVIALGGGVVGDIAGFIASVFMRGVPYVQIPTTLLAQVDSSIGGKTGINLKTGKNLLGTFYQPVCVITDILFLGTLPKKEYINGLAEVIKYSLIGKKPALSLLEEESGRLLKREKEFLLNMVADCCKAKRTIVSKDEKEKSARQILNFGHTIGHAIENASGYRISHGKAISKGMITACHLSDELTGFSPIETARVRDIIKNAGLEFEINNNISAEQIMNGLATDKKKDGGRINFVLLEKIGAPLINFEVPKKTLRRMLRHIL